MNPDLTFDDVGLSIAVFTLTAFVIDRVAKHVVLALEILPLVGRWFGKHEDAAAALVDTAPEPGAFSSPIEKLTSIYEKKRQVLYFVVAGGLGWAVARTFGELQILSLLMDTKAWGDAEWQMAAVINGLLLMGGADIASMTFTGSRLTGSRSAPAPDPVQLTVNVNPGEGEVTTTQAALPAPDAKEVPAEKSGLDH